MEPGSLLAIKKQELHLRKAEKVKKSMYEHMRAAADPDRLAMMYLVRMHQLNSIEIQFLVSGHSFMPCYQNIAVIEERKKKVKVMVPSETKDLIRTTKFEWPFKVVDIEQDGFGTFIRWPINF